MKHFQFMTLIFCTLALMACGSDNAENSAAPAQSSPTVASSSGTEEHPGKEIYNNYCMSCHMPGLSGAPKLGDVAAWAPRIAKGKDLLVQTTIEGVQPAMPPRGMCFSCSDEDIVAVVDYMIQQSQ